MHKKRSFKFFLCCGLLVAVGALAGSYYYRQNLPADSGLTPSLKASSFPKLTQIDSSTLPEGLPKDLPLEKDAVITQNYRAETGEKVQYTRQYVSAKDPGENFDLFEAYLDKSGWKIVSSSASEANIKSLAATKDGQVMNLNFGLTPGSNQGFVDISVTKSGQ